MDHWELNHSLRRASACRFVPRAYVLISRESRGLHASRTTTGLQSALRTTHLESSLLPNNYRLWIGRPESSLNQLLRALGVSLKASTLGEACFTGACGRVVEKNAAFR